MTAVQTGKGDGQLGLAPLRFATGVASLTRRGVGTAVFGGMIAATALGVFAIPLL